MKRKTEIKRYQIAEEEGLDTSVVKEFEAVYEVPKKKMASLLGVSEKTYYNLMAQAVFDRERADRFLFIERIFEEGEDTFQTKENLRSWLQLTHPNLNHKKPIDLLESLNGSQAVLAEIIRTRHNVLS